MARPLLSRLAMRNAWSIAVLGIVAAPLIGGCGSTVVDERSGSGGGGTSSGASTTSTGSASTSGSSTTGSTGTGEVCSAFDDEPGTAQVTIHLRNESPQPIYVPGSCNTIALSIQSMAGGDATSFWYDPSCLQTCEDLQTQPPYACGACPPVVYEIPPFGERQIPWDGTGLQPDQAMPAACWASAGGLATCSRVVGAPAGGYAIAATGYAACEGPCQCDAEGACPGQPAGMQVTTDPATITVPGATEVDVVFGTCAFGCPAGGAGG